MYVTRDDLESLMEKYPTLCNDGITYASRVYTLGEQDRKRQSLINRLDAINKICFWIKQSLYKSVTMCRKYNSAALKSVCEHDIGYISTGEFTAAMLLSGYTIEETGCWWAYFNVDTRHISKIIEEQNNGTRN